MGAGCRAEHGRAESYQHLRRWSLDITLAIAHFCWTFRKEESGRLEGYTSAVA
jgi:hypothetical protein